MPESPLKNSDGDVIVTLTCDGAPLPADTEILSAEVTHAVNRIPTARIVLLDDSEVDPALRFALSDGALFKPGAA